MVDLWRIAQDTPSYGADDLSGTGARLSGGRWNWQGIPMLYTSTTRALACLETVVHLARQPLPLNRYLVCLSVPLAHWEAAEEVQPSQWIGWDAQPAGLVSLNWGSAWAAAEKTLLARVPSVIVEEEFNVLINPLHPEISTVTAKKIRRWQYDLRLLPAEAS